MDPDRRIVGIKHVSANEPYLYGEPGRTPELPSAIMLESVAQVGAILILSKPENHDKFIVLTGITRVRYRRPVYVGQTVLIEARVRRIKGPAGQMSGSATVDGEIVGRGTMSFVLIPRPQ
jgi:3-hydroxyacyl-[acyl-carrier-protein] dehydratase